MFNRTGLIVAIVTLIVILVGVGALSAYVALENERMYLYPKCGTVTQINKVAKTITITDYFGDNWIWEDDSIAGWTKGDIVSMVMHSNRTPETHTDDIIIKIKYEGHTSH